MTINDHLMTDDSSMTNDYLLTFDINTNYK